jgi:hypothetical protein
VSRRTRPGWRRSGELSRRDNTPFQRLAHYARPHFPERGCMTRPDADREGSGSRVDRSRSIPQPEALTPQAVPLSASPAEDAGPRDGETFSQYVTRTRGPVEAARLGGVLEAQRRAFPRRLAEAQLIRAMAARIGGPMHCPTCDCLMFFLDEADLADGQPDVDACPLCDPAKALDYLNSARHYADTHL